jgi:hypothetical protein
LCDFTSQSYNVIAMDNLLTGNIANIAHITADNFTFIKHE